MAEVQTKALFTCTEAGYDAALSIMELYRRNGMQAFFYGIAEEADLVSLGEINKMTKASGWSALRMKWAALRWTSASMI